jgi:hypothetical protein
MAKKPRNRTGNRVGRPAGPSRNLSERDGQYLYEILDLVLHEGLTWTAAIDRVSELHGDDSYRGGAGERGRTPRTKNSDGETERLQKGASAQPRRPNPDSLRTHLWGLRRELMRILHGPDPDQALAFWMRNVLQNGACDPASARMWEKIYCFIDFVPLRGLRAAESEKGSASESEQPATGQD